MSELGNLHKREYVARTLIVLSAVAIIFAVLGNLFFGPIMGIDPEGFSRACNNLALVGIGISICFQAPKIEG